MANPIQSSSSGSIYASPSSIASQKEKKIKADIEKEVEKISTQKGPSSYLESSDPAKSIGHSIKISQLETNKVCANYFDNLYNHMTSQLSQSMDIATRLKTSIVQALNQVTQMPHDLFIGQINSYLNELTVVLNSRYEEFSTLSGVGIITNAVFDLSTLSPLQAGDISDNSYYQGGKNNISINLGDVSINPYPINAKDNFFVNIIHTCQLCLSFNNSSETGIAALRSANDKIQGAINNDYGVALQSVVNQKNTIIKLVQTTDLSITYENSSLETLDSVDHLSALMRYQELQSSRELIQSLFIDKSKRDEEFVNAITRLL